MTPLISKAASMADLGEDIFLTLGMIAVVLLLALLLIKEFLQAAGRTRPAADTRVFNIALVPLLISFALIVVLRAIQLIPTY